MTKAASQKLTRMKNQHRARRNPKTKTKTGKISIGWIKLRKKGGTNTASRKGGCSPEKNNIEVLV